MCGHQLDLGQVKNVPPKTPQISDRTPSSPEEKAHPMTPINVIIEECKSEENNRESLKTGLNHHKKSNKKKKKNKPLLKRSTLSTRDIKSHFPYQYFNNL